MVYNSKTLQNGIRAQFQRAYSAMLARPYLEQFRALYTPVTSNSAEEKYAWLGDLPGVREWIGDKSLGGIKDYDYTIRNRDWYDGFAIDRNEIEDEKIAAIQPRVETLAMSLAKWPWELVSQLIREGDSRLAYDGSAFFADRTVNDNLLDGSGTTVANIKTDISTARSAMMKFQSDSGRPLGLMLDTVVVPPEIEGAMLEAVRSSDNIAVDGSGNAFNPASGWIRNVIVDPQLEDSDDWYGFATDYPIKPFIFQSRKQPIDVLDDTEVAKNRKLYYSAEMRGNAGYGFPQMAVKVVNS